MVRSPANPWATRVPTGPTAVTVPVCTFFPFVGTFTNIDAKPVRSVIGEPVLTHWLKVAVLVFVFAAAGEAPARSPSDAALAQATSASRAERFLTMHFFLPSRYRPKAPSVPVNTEPTRSEGVRQARLPSPRPGGGLRRNRRSPRANEELD